MTQEQDDSPEQSQSADTAPSDLHAELEDEKSKAGAYLANWQRSQADFANYKRRTEQERRDQARYSEAQVLGSLLPIVDDMERALAGVPPQLYSITWVDGVALIHRKLLAVLESHGVRPIESQGQKFDPNLHQAIMQVPGPEATVMAELQRGYQLYDRVLRPSMVQVGDGTEETDTTAETGPEGTTEQSSNTGETPDNSNDTSAD